MNGKITPKFHYVINYVCKQTGDMIAIADTINGNENLLPHIEKWKEKGKKYGQEIDFISQSNTATAARQLADYWNDCYNRSGSLDKWYLREPIAQY